LLFWSLRHIVVGYVNDVAAAGFLRFFASIWILYAMSSPPTFAGGVHLKMNVSDPGRVSKVRRSAPSFGSSNIGAAKAQAGAVVGGGPAGAGGTVRVAVGLAAATTRVAVRVGVLAMTSV
jgi:hypothetical protein